MDVYAVAGQRIYIGTDPVDLPDEDLIASDFASVAWIEIDGWQTAGASGDTAALITTALINRARDIKQKGTRNAGSMQNTFALDRDDPGQVKLQTAQGNDLNYPIRIVGNDEPAVGSAPAPSERLFYALVMSASEQGGQANTAQMLQSTFEINTNIVVVPATSGAVPVNLTIPAVAGIPQQGQVLTAWPGIWNYAEEYEYQWQSGGVDIDGATASTYTPVVGDVGDVLRVRVLATNAAGSSAFVASANAPAVLSP